jgi:hypothetical protein
MTDAQQKCLDECHARLGEHFDAFVVVTSTEVGNGADIRISHGGGFHAALGLLSDAQNFYLQRAFATGKGPASE